MDLQELKQILEKDRGKIIIVENGKPLMVILPYGHHPAQEEPRETREEPENEFEQAEPGPEELTIDDLPIDDLPI